MNHESFSNSIKEIEIKTQLRRVSLLYTSEVLGDSYEYASNQLERKAPRHLKDFGISTEGKSLEEMAIEYKDLVETIFAKPDLVVRKDGTLNKQEPTINMGDPETLGIVAFENNPLYDKKRFITSYTISEKAFERFEKTGCIGMILLKRAAGINELQRLQMQAQRKWYNASSLHKSLPEDARIGNQQLREDEALNQKLMEDSKFPLTQKEKNLLRRAEKYKQHKNEFYQNNPDIARDEF